MPEITFANVLEVTLKSTYLGQQCLNKFYYASNTFINTLADFATAWTTLIIPELQTVSSNLVEFTQVDIQQVKGGTVFGTFAQGQVGSVSGDGLPPFASWDFTLLRGGARERNGYKRFVGVPESFQVNGVATSSAISNLNPVAAALFAPVDTADDTWDPVIRRTKIGRVTQNPPKYYSISSVVYSKIGTQNSRKFGHGR